jgi:chromosome partitioning protein
MTRALVLTNNKGGVGKSTSATNIALGIAALLRQAGVKHRRVLLVDTDSQAHATLVTTGRNDFVTQNSLYTVLMADRQAAAQTLARVIVPSHWDDNLHVLPASSLLEQAERELQGTADSPFRLADSLAKIAPHYAAIVIDTRPSFSLLTEMALIAATDAIVPVEPRYLETVGLLNVISKINAIREGWRSATPRVSGILITKMDRRVRGHRHALEEIRANARLGRLLCGVIPMNEAVSYAHRSHQSIFAYDPKASASRAYAQVVGRLVKQIGGSNAQA